VIFKMKIIYSQLSGTDIEPVPVTRKKAARPKKPKCPIAMALDKGFEKAALARFADRIAAIQKVFPGIEVGDYGSDKR